MQDLHITVPLIGLTGGIGSGKSTVAALFEQKGAKLIYADDLAKELLWKDDSVHNLVVSLFGNDICDKNGRIIKEKLAEAAFQSAESINKLNAIVHPAVVKEIAKIVKETESERSHPIVVVEAALIFEAKIEGLFDMIISVVAPEDVRIERIVKRDNSTREAVEGRISQQVPQAVHFERSDLVIGNEGSLNSFLNEAENVVSGIFDKLQ